MNLSCSFAAVLDLAILCWRRDFYISFFKCVIKYCYLKVLFSKQRILFKHDWVPLLWSWNKCYFCGKYMAIQLSMEPTEDAAFPFLPRYLDHSQSAGSWSLAIASPWSFFFFFFNVANYKPIRIIERVIILIVLSDIETSIILWLELHNCR